MFSAFVLQEVHAQTLQSINTFYFLYFLNSSRNRLRCTAVQIRYDPDENECFLYLDSQQSLPTLISTYSILVPYLSRPSVDSDTPEFSVENGSPRFHLPFFYGVVSSQSAANHAPLRVRVDVFRIAETFPDLLDRLDGTTAVLLALSFMDA